MFKTVSEQKTSNKHGKLKKQRKAQKIRLKLRKIGSWEPLRGLAGPWRRLHCLARPPQKERKQRKAGKIKGKLMKIS